MLGSFGRHRAAARHWGSALQGGWYHCHLGTGHTGQADLAAQKPPWLPTWAGRRLDLLSPSEVGDRTSSALEPRRQSHRAGAGEWGRVPTESQAPK